MRFLAGFFRSAGEEVGVYVKTRCLKPCFFEKSWNKSKKNTNVIDYFNNYGLIVCKETGSFISQGAASVV